jgi:hypothetical protein
MQDHEPKLMFFDFRCFAAEEILFGMFSVLRALAGGGCDWNAGVSPAISL